MKRLFYLIVIITLPIIAWFQYSQYRRFHPPKDYSFPLSDDIDAEYHDPELIKSYYLAAEEIENYASYAWNKHGVDVKMGSPMDPEEKKFVETWQKMIAAARFMELKLKNSKELKAKGMTNEQIRKQEIGISYQLDAKDLLNNQVIAQQGQESGTVYEIQKMLISRGYDIPLDGIFKEETYQAVQKFQQTRNLFPSGIVDMLTLKSLMN